MSHVLSRISQYDSCQHEQVRLLFPGELHESLPDDWADLADVEICSVCNAIVSVKALPAGTMRLW